MKEIKWTYEACYNEAKKYKTMKDFCKYSKNAHSIALNKGWLNDYAWLEREKIYWTEDMIKFELENGQYISKVDLRRKNPALYSAAFRRGLLDIFFNNLHQSYEYNTVREIAKKYKHKRDFQKAEPNMYAACYRLGWLDTFDWFKPKSSPYKDNIHCVYMRMNEELKIVYVGLTVDFESRMKSEEREKDRVYKYFRDYNVTVPPGVKYLGGVPLSTEEAQRIEAKTIEWFANNGWTVLNKAKAGIGYSAIGSVAKKWTPYRIEKAKNKCQDIKEFREKYPGAYQAAMRSGITIDLPYTRAQPGYWAEKENCRLAAQDCKSAAEFSQKYPGAYVVSRKNKWVKEFFPVGHYKRTILMLSIDGEVLNEFETFRSAGNFLGIKDISNICKCCKGKHPKAYGYKWKYKKGS